MNRENRLLVGILIVMWIAFLTWQIMVQDWLGELEDDMIRLDLVLVLPGLVIISLLVGLLVRNDMRK